MSKARLLAAYLFGVLLCMLTLEFLLRVDWAPLFLILLTMLSSLFLICSSLYLLLETFRSSEDADSPDADPRG